MKKNTILINGKEYPCRMTMGAMLEYQNRTGKEATEINGTDFSQVVILLYCCLLSSARADGIELPFADEMAMADHLMPEDLAGWQTGNFQAEGNSEVEASKKKG